MKSKDSGPNVDGPNKDGPNNDRRRWRTREDGSNNDGSSEDAFNKDGTKDEWRSGWWMVTLTLSHPWRMTMTIRMTDYDSYDEGRFQWRFGWWTIQMTNGDLVDGWRPSHVPHPCLPCLPSPFSISSWQTFLEQIGLVTNTYIQMCFSIQKLQWF